MKSLSSANQPFTGLDRWLTTVGLRENPFERWQADYDLNLPDYFVDIGGFDELLRLTDPCLVFARRGCGKTAQRQMLAAQCRPLRRDSSRLAITYTYDGFERALRGAGGDVESLLERHHVGAVLHLALDALAEEARRDPGIQSRLAGHDAVRMLTDYAARLEAPTSASSDPTDDLGTLEILKDFAGLLHDAGLGPCAVLVDGLDEFGPAADGYNPSTGEADYALRFLAPLLHALPVISCPGWAFKFYLPQEFEPALRARSWFRADRLRLFHISWNKDSLLKLIAQRLAHFSTRRPAYEDLAQLCEDSLAEIIDDELISQAGALPRAVLVLADMLLQTHSRQPEPAPVIALRTWQQALEQWQQRRVDFGLGEAPPTQPSAAVPESPPVAAEQSPTELRVDEERGLVWLGKREIRKAINPQDYRVLACLYRHRSGVCSKDLIAQEAWPEAENLAGITDQAIAQAITRLRKALHKIEPGRKYIETIRDKQRTLGGYRLHPEGF